MPLSVNFDTLLILKPANSTISFPRSAWNARFDALRRVGDHSLEIATTDRDAERRNSRSHAQRGNECFEFACLKVNLSSRHLRERMEDKKAQRQCSGLRSQSLDSPRRPLLAERVLVNRPPAVPLAAFGRVGTTAGVLWTNAMCPTRLLCQRLSSQ